MLITLSAGCHPNNNENISLNMNENLVPFVISQVIKDSILVIQFPTQYQIEPLK
uniref:Uncharacterized protein n=1 Tax=Rhizophagus irregularis (strain DAOM 181602 / DAOM 197198 / MUCL 43194) TaxID=747089 RepID=U9TET4_RHIID